MTARSFISQGSTLRVAVVELLVWPLGVVPIATHVEDSAERRLRFRIQLDEIEPAGASACERIRERDYADQSSIGLHEPYAGRFDALVDLDFRDRSLALASAR